MIFKRVPLFMFGLVYGAVVLPIYSVCYGVVFCIGALYYTMMNVVVPYLMPDNFCKAIYEIFLEALYATSAMAAMIACMALIKVAIAGVSIFTSGVMTGIAILLGMIFCFALVMPFILNIVISVSLLIGGAVIGAVCGTMQGLCEGLVWTWHCAMNFYDNGFIQGLGFPIRLSQALIVFIMDGDYAKLSELGTTANTASAKASREVVQTHVAMTTRIVRDTLESETNNRCPDGVSTLITEYALLTDSDEPASLLQQLAIPREERVRRVTRWIESIGEPGLVNPQQPATVGEVVNEAEIRKIVMEVLHPQRAVNI